MGVIQKQLTSSSGFRSPGFTVDSAGNLTASSINSLGSLLINGLPFISGTELASTITGSNLQTLGRLTELHASTDANTNDVLTVTNLGITTSAIAVVSLANGLIRLDPVNAPNTVAIGPAGSSSVQLEISGKVNINSTTTSSSTTTGSIVAAGGAGIAENIHVGGSVYIAGETYIAGQNIKSLAAALAVALS